MTIRPSHTTDALWELWLAIVANVPGAVLAGTYANKSGYHNTVNANILKWHGEYSSVLAPDLNFGNRDVARAIDITMPDAQMRLRTGYMKRAAEHPQDDRLDCMRSFIGTLDSKRVFCMIKDGVSGEKFAWRIDWGRDSTHLWHQHDSIFAQYINIWKASPGNPGLEAVASVWTGETWESWVARKAGKKMAAVIQITEAVPMPPEFQYPNNVIAKGALYGTGGNGFFHILDPRRLDMYTKAWSITGTPTWNGTFQAAKDTYGPFLGNSEKLLAPPGPSGPAILVKHTHPTPAGATGEAELA